MTTIVVSRPLMMMASDSSVTLGDMRVPSSPKMFRETGFIVGMGGSIGNFKLFVNWRSGFVVLTFHKGQLLWPEVVHVIGDGEVEFRGSVIDV